MKSLEFIYQDTQIHFVLGNDKNVMVNATEMAKAFGKRIDVFLKADHVKEFISVLEFTPYGGNSENLKREEIIQTKGQSGTYFHRILALKFAAWLDPKFEVWVYSVIEDILFGSAKAVGKKLTEKEKAKKELSNIVQNIYATDNKEAIQLLNQLQLVKDLEKEANKEFSNLKKQYTIFD